MSLRVSNLFYLSSLYFFFFFCRKYPQLCFLWEPITRYIGDSLIDPCSFSRRRIPAFCCCCYCCFFVFLVHMEVPTPGVESELQLLAYISATAMSDPSHICELHHNSWQHWIPNPLSRARDRTCVPPHGLVAFVTTEPLWELQIRGFSTSFFVFFCHF